MRQENKKEPYFTKDKNFYRSFIQLAAALMLQQAVVLSVNLADNIMLGGYSEISLSGVAAVNQIQFVLQQVVFGVTNGMVILASQYWGKKDTETIRKVLSPAFRYAVGLAAVFFLAVTLMPHGILKLFTNEEAIIGEGMRYLKIVRFSYLFFGITTVLLGSMRAVEKVKIALYVSVMALVVNCSINYTLIEGHFGFPRLGVCGAAIGTLTARILECAVVCFYVFRKDKTLGIRISGLLQVDKKLTRDYLKVMLPVFGTSVLWGINTALQTVILGHMSASAIAAHSISSTVFLFLKVASVGAASASSVLIGKTVGEQNLPRLREYTRTLQVIFLCIGTLLAATLLLIRVPFLNLYVLTDETRSLANSFLLIEATVLFFMSYQMCTNIGIICGGGDSKYVLYIDLVGIWMIALPLSFASAFWWKAAPVIVLICLNLDQYLKCISAFVYANSYRWVRNLTKDSKQIS